MMPVTKVHVFRFDVLVTVTPTWTWAFEPGQRLTTDVPGSRYPDMTVSHTYTSPGARTVVLDTSWKGKFSVGDYGPYDITDPATQGPVALPIEVHAIQPVLTN